MSVLHFDLSKISGGFKPMNAVNNGPIHKIKAWGSLSNLEAYKAAKIPFARNHDAAFCASYGGPYTVDISGIFPNFDADADDPGSYDFTCTDDYIAVTALAGTETFYRLGNRIEHEVRKHGTLPPKDFGKWVDICEHIIMHYNYGWADGYKYNIRYWEIWNEPDLDPDDSDNKRTWGGTKVQFFDLYELAAKRLKARFPELYIGGPAVSGKLDWTEDFLREMQKRNVPLDFFSWHVYGPTPQKMIKRAESMRALLDKYGYEKTASILNEWNYIEDWDAKYIYSLRKISELKGSSFNLACMAEAQKSSIDMLMYYDARPTGFNGMFDGLSYSVKKGYYPFLWFGTLYGMKEVRCADSQENVYTICGVDENGKATLLMTHYEDDDNALPTDVEIDLGRRGKYDVYMLDDENDGKLIKTTESLRFRLPVHCSVMVKEI